MTSDANEIAHDRKQKGTKGNKVGLQTRRGCMLEQKGTKGNEGGKEAKDNTHHGERKGMRWDMMQ